MESSSQQSSVVSSVVVVEKNKNVKVSTGGTGESSKASYLERVNDLDLENLAYRRELMEVLGLVARGSEQRLLRGLAECA